MPVELLVLTAVAGVTRLAGITSPNAIVFDEVYFREYALRYQTGSYYFDLHPPLGKLLLGGWAALLGVHVDPASPDPAVALRVLPALAGIALVPVFYQLLRELSASRKVATLGAGLVVLDNALLVESRLVLVDSMLLLFGVSALVCALAARRLGGRREWVLLAAGAALAGMAVATKWTGASVLGLLLLGWLVRTVRERVPWRRAAGMLAVLVVVPALVYLTTFAVHFALLPDSGPGDAYMSAQFQSTLRGNPAYDPNATMSFADRFLELNRAMPAYEDSLNTSVHPYSSTWLTWPTMKRGVYYYNGPGADPGTQHYVYLLGNPVVWWGTLVGLVVVALGWMRRPERFARHVTGMVVLAIAWAADYFPFAAIVRPMFLYHYFFALLFAIGFVSIGVGALAGWSDDDGSAGGAWRFPSRRSSALYVGVLAAAAACFLFFAPISYGSALSDAGLSDRMWLSTWR